MESLRGLLTDELAEHSGSEAFLCWIREDQQPSEEPVA
jgi:hypothetical protein